MATARKQKGLDVENGSQRYLAQYFTDMASYYDSSLHERNGSSSAHKQHQAGFYLSLADHIRSLADDDLRVIALTRLTGFDDEMGFSPGPRVSAAIADAGQFVEGSPEAFLEYLVHAALDDQLDTHTHTTRILMESMELDGSRA